MDNPRRSLVILGLGNVLCGDDGVGVAVVQSLVARCRWTEEVEILDGGTLGLALLSHLRSVDDLVLVDAVRAAQPPGSLVRLEGEEVSSAARERLSVHQIGVADLLDALRLLDEFPRRLVLWGVVPERLELGDRFSPAVAESVERLYRCVVEEAQTLGYAVREAENETTIATGSIDYSRLAGGVGGWL